MASFYRYRTRLARSAAKRRRRSSTLVSQTSGLASAAIKLAGPTKRLAARVAKLATKAVRLRRAVSAGAATSSFAVGLRPNTIGRASAAIRRSRALRRASAMRAARRRRFLAARRRAWRRRKTIRMTMPRGARRQRQMMAVTVALRAAQAELFALGAQLRLLRAAVRK
jgi:hypothetical protein